MDADVAAVTAATKCVACVAAGALFLVCVCEFLCCFGVERNYRRFVYLFVCVVVFGARLGASEYDMGVFAYFR